MQKTPELEYLRKLPFFFILGRPRSGTTLLRTLLDAHPNITIPLENSGLIHLYYKYRKVLNWDSKKLQELFIDFKNLNFIDSWNIDWNSVEGIFDHASHLHLEFHEIIRIYYYHYQSEFAKEEILMLGDKSPLNSLYAKEIFQIFPGAKYIHLVRDYRANLASMSKHDVFSPSSTAMLMQWRKSVNQINKLAFTYPQRFLQIRYEDLVLHPEESYEKICVFLNVTYVPSLLYPEYRKKAVKNIYNSAFLDQWQPDLSGKISSSNIDKWKKQLSPAAIRKADYIAGRRGKLFHYEPVSKGYSILFVLITEMKKLLFHLNEMMRYLYDRLPYRMKTRIKNRKFILSYRLIHLYRKQFGKH